MAWIRFAAVQLIMLIATMIGLVLLLPFCLGKAWEPAISTLNGRQIDRWTWRLLFPFQNPEDGVSGQTALVWLNGETQGPYLPNAPAWWRAYRWSALRNSCDNLKYVFAWDKGPLIETKHLKMGWQPENGFNVPILSVRL